MFKPFLTSLTRITDFDTRKFECAPVGRENWAAGDYVVGEVTGRSNPLYFAELQCGRMSPLLEGDLVIGAFGKRAGTLEGVGDWEAIGEDGVLHALTNGGLFGRMTSRTHLLPEFMSMNYKGHIMRGGAKVVMKDFVEPVEPAELTMPVILLIGTSMSAGKTTSGRVIIHELKRAGLTVAAAKLTGASRYRDVLSFDDAGADYLYDFVDIGLPSTVCPPDEFREALPQLLSRLAHTGADVLVAEAGASPLEPYNGSIAMEMLENKLKMVVLSASDPYAVMGVQHAFGHQPDLVTGPAANTQAGIDLVRKLTGLTALNMILRRSLPQLRQIMGEKLGMEL